MEKQTVTRSVHPGKTTARRVHNRLTKHGNFFARDAIYGLQSSLEIMTVQWGSFSTLNNANLLKRHPLVKLMFKELGFLLYYRFWKTNLQVKKISFKEWKILLVSLYIVMLAMISINLKLLSRFITILGNIFWAVFFLLRKLKIRSVQKRNNKTEDIWKMEAITPSFCPFHFIFCRPPFCIKVILFQRITLSISNFRKREGWVGLIEWGERGLSYLFCNFVHCTCQVAHISWRHTSDGNSAIFGQVDGVFFSKPFNLKIQTSNLAYCTLYQKNSWLALLPRRRSEITLTKTIKPPEIAPLVCISLNQFWYKPCFFEILNFPQLLDLK